MRNVKQRIGIRNRKSSSSQATSSDNVTLIVTFSSVILISIYLGYNELWYRNIRTVYAYLNSVQRPERKDQLPANSSP